MKKFILYELLFLTLLGQSQNNTIPKINFQYKTQTQNEYVKFLNIKDTNSLIIRASVSGMYDCNIVYIVFQTNGKIKKFSEYYRDPMKKKELNSVRIKRKNYKFYWELLDTRLKDKRLEINLNILNAVVDSATLFSFIPDRSNLSLGIYKNNEGTYFSMYSGISYKSENHPVNIETRKLYALIHEIYNVFNKY